MWTQANIVNFFLALPTYPCADQIISKYATLCEEGMTLGDAQRLLGAGHSAFSVSGPITPDNEQFQARFPDPADASHEILVTFVYGGAFKAQFIGMVEDSFSASTPSGANK